MRRSWISLLIWILAICPAMGVSWEDGSSPVLKIMAQELKRSFDGLQEASPPPYFLSYEITQTESRSAAAAFGSLTSGGKRTFRQLGIDLRVGDHQLDNTHPVRGGFRNFFGNFHWTQVPVENEADALKTTLWYHTDQRYKAAAQQLAQVKTNVKVMVKEEDQSADFSKSSPSSFIEAPTPLEFDRELWEEKVRKYSRPFADYGQIYQATASIRATSEIRWFVSSEGSRLQTTVNRYQLFVTALTKAEDGMELPRYESFFARTPDGLPSDEEVLQTVERMIADLLALREAPLVAPYTGPAILSGRAGGVFFHEVFGHRVEGHRQKRAEEGQTFKKKIGEPVLPSIFSVRFDPTREKQDEQDLAGSYRFDNEGVSARNVTVIEQGVLKTFLMSRSPVEGVPVSNGHGRAQAGFRPVARQSNLLVEVSEPVSQERLKEMLLEEVRRQGKPFGLYFDDIQGGFTMTGRTMPNSFNVLPIMVYRIYPDGREELVRGVDLIGTPLTAFSKLIAADDRSTVFNGVCGAESGGVPVSAVSPSLLVTQIEVQKKTKSQHRPPVLKAPFKGKGGIS